MAFEERERRPLPCMAVWRCIVEGEDSAAWLLHGMGSGDYRLGVVYYPTTHFRKGRMGWCRHFSCMIQLLGINGEKERELVGGVEPLIMQAALHVSRFLPSPETISPYYLAC